MYSSPGRARNFLTTLTLTVLAGSVLVAVSAPAEAFDPLPKATQTTIAVGGESALVIAANGRIYATGRNGDLELPGIADGAQVATLTATTALPGGVRAKAVAAGTAHSVALAANGRVYTAGRNNAGQLASGSSGAPRGSWGEVTGLPEGATPIRAIAAAGLSTYVLGSDRKVYGAGTNANHQISAANTESITAMTEIALPENQQVSAIAAGGRSNGLDGFVLALDQTEGCVYGRGDNARGQLAGLAGGDVLAFTQLSSFPCGATAVAAGGTSSYAVTSAGLVMAAGGNSNGQLANNSTSPAAGAVTMSYAAPAAGVTAVSIAAGDSHALVAGSDQILYAVGNADRGAIGNGQTAVDPLVLSPVAAAPATAIGTPVEVAASASTSLVRNSDGLALGAGNGSEQQLTGAAEDKLSITQLSGQEMISYGVPSLPGAPRVGQVISVQPGQWSVRPTSYEYTWHRNGVVLPDQTGATYTIVPGDVGLPLTVTLVGMRPGLADSEPVQSLAVTPVNGVFTSVPAPSFTGKAVVGSTLTARSSGTAPIPDTTSFAWLRDGLEVSTGPTRRLVPADAGREIAVQVTVAKAGYLAGHATSAVRVIPLHNLARPSIKGKAKVGKKLRIKSVGDWAPQPTSFRYQWLRNGKAIKRASKPVYKVTPKDIGKRISVRVTALKPGVPRTGATSLRTTKIAKL